MPFKDDFVYCDFGGTKHRHWGLLGAAGLFLISGDEVLLQLRAQAHHGNLWAVPGGALKPDEIPLAAAIRETHEETAIDLLDQPFQYLGQYVLDHGGWRYTTIIVQTDNKPYATVTNNESADIRWVPIANLHEYDLLPSFADAVPALLAAAIAQ